MVTAGFKTLLTDTSVPVAAAIIPEVVKEAGLSGRPMTEDDKLSRSSGTFLSSASFLRALNICIETKTSLAASIMWPNVSHRSCN